MSNAKLKPVAEINLEEFERRLRASVAPQAGVEDPLAELTRLVDTIGFDRSPAERALEATRPPAPAQKPELRLAPPPAPVAPPTPPAPAPGAPVAARPEPVEPLLRPSFGPEDLDSAAFAPPQPDAPPLEDVVEAQTPPFAPLAAASRPRNWGLKVGGLLAAAAVMAGAVVVFKVGGVRHLGAPPLILASTTPTRVAPPSDETIRTAGESGALLTRDTAQPTPTPPKLVNPPEAPVDLAARPQPASTIASASPSANASAEADASPVAPSSDTPIVASASPAATPSSPVSADPSRVKTISVRPDGTLISSGYDAPAAAPSPAPAENRAAEATDGEASSPAVALPTKLSPPKSNARVVSKTETTAPADAGAGPIPVAPKSKKPKPTPTPAAETAKTDDGADAPAVPSGGYAVQLAAPRSESEAKALIRSLSSRYSEALSGASLGVRKAERDGSPIYRVRAGGLSKADAAAMCAKVKQAGGDCYVAKN